MIFFKSMLNANILFPRVTISSYISLLDSKNPQKITLMRDCLTLPTGPSSKQLVLIAEITGSGRGVGEGLDWKKKKKKSTLSK